MTRLRTAGITAAPPANVSRLRVAGVTAAPTAAPSPSRLRLTRIAGSFTTRPTIAAFADMPNLEPESIATVTAVLAPGSPAADAWSWRRVSGPVVTLSGSGPTRSIITPSTDAGATIVLGVKASTGGVESAERLITLTVLPQISWYRVHPSQVWKGRSRTGPGASTNSYTNGYTNTY